MGFRFSHKYYPGVDIMMHTTSTLYNELHQTLRNIDEQIEDLKMLAEELTISWLNYTLPDGSRPATPLLLARAHCLSAMAALRLDAAPSRGRK